MPRGNCFRFQHIHAQYFLDFIDKYTNNERICKQHRCQALSTRNWMPVSSATFPISPPNASISLTRCPLPIPPIAGLHDICAIVSRDSVTSRVSAPILAATNAASQPACPPPITSTSCVFGSVFICYKILNIRRDY